MFRKMICLWLAILLLTAWLPQVKAAETLLTEEITVAAGEALPSEELYEAYLEDLFYDNGISFFGEAAREQLGEKEQHFYDHLKAHLEKVASGQESSSAVRVTGQQLVEWGGPEYYVSTTTQAALGAVIAEFHAAEVLHALLHDCPYELYWFDKVSGMRAAGSISNMGSAGNGKLNFSVNYLEFRFSVVQDHQPEDYNAKAPTVDTTNAAAAAAAAENARKLVEKHAGKNDYQKLRAYKEEICGLVSYNKGVSASQFSLDADPWQLIWVFDGNSSTNVVCEGYSKAFQYLYDCSQFGSGTDCYTVTGTLITGKTEGHMWNIVTLDGGNYLVDVTNSDSGTAGWNGSLFLAGGTGDLLSGYSVGTVGFAYDDETLSLWGTGEDSILNLSQESYDPCALGHTEVTDPAVNATCTQSGLTEGKHCSVCGETIIAQEVIPAGHKIQDGICTVCGSYGGTCGENVFWSLDSAGQLTIFGSGDMTEYSKKEGNSAYHQNVPWENYRESILSVVVSEGVTSVSGFHDLTNVSSVVLPSSLDSISYYAFCGCTGLQTVNIPQDVQDIGGFAFYNCDKLTSLSVPVGVTSIGSSAFPGCAVSYAGTITDWREICEASSYAVCTDGTIAGWGACGDALTWDLIDGKLAFYGTGAMTDYPWTSDAPWFAHRDLISDIALPVGMTSIGDCAFAGLRKVASVTIPESISHIGRYAFYGCDKLTEMTLPGSVMTIGDYVFEKCGNLTNVEFRGDAPTFAEKAFYMNQFTASYPVGNTTWTPDVMQDYGGNITWKPRCLGDHDWQGGSCTEPKVCKLCGETGSEAPGHSEVTLPGKAASCTETGLTDGKKCTVCGEITEKQQTIPTTSHKEVTVAGKAATCTETGLTEGKKCSVCGTVTKAQEVIQKLAHKAEVLKGTPATCGKEGKSDGTKCSVCGTVTKAQSVLPATGKHTYDDAYDAHCNVCGHVREALKTTPMYRMYDPNSSEHFYTGSIEEREILVKEGWNYEGVGFNFPVAGEPVHRLYEPKTGEHLYTMDEAEMNALLVQGWNYEGVAFNSAGKDEVPQYRLHNPNATRGAYHFTGSTEERDYLMSLGWEFQGIGWYSCLK